MYIDIHRHAYNHGGASVVLRNLFHTETAEIENQPYCSVGLHPWHVHSETLKNDVKAVEAVANKQRVLAIGEAGLDKTRDTPLDVQHEAFTKQIDIAAKNQLPMVIHCVRAYSEISGIRRHNLKLKPWIFHWFNAGIQVANDLLAKGCYLSFGHMLFYETSKAYKVFTKIPLEKVFFETDDAQFSIEEVYYKAAQLKGMDVSNLQAHIAGNFKKVFGITL